MRKKKKRKKYAESVAITKEQLKKRLIGMNHRDKALICLLWLTGARISEALEVRGVNFNPAEQDGKKFIKVRLKTLKRRKKEIPMRTVIIDLQRDADLWQHIEFYMGIRQPLETIFKINRKTAWRIAKKHGFVKTHNLRHSAITEWAKRGLPITYVQDLGGWASLQMLEVYRHEFSAKEILDWYARSS